ncbi:MAG: hypothetical protein HQK54_10865 [Oligoflexales bacterium]|nr:hypothetical protein [Oligoflexales bacterium]
MAWFYNLVGFRETSPEDIRAKISIDGELLKSKVNNRSFFCGRFDTPSLCVLRNKISQQKLAKGKLRLSEIVNNVQTLHTDPQNSGSIFQVASQFNTLEMTSPEVTPEDGIDIYERDKTQGPACAISAGAGTIFRNYFVNVNGNIGQSKDHQIDCLAEIGKYLGNVNNELWEMKNGYALASSTGLKKIGDKLRSLSETEIDVLRGLLKVGVQYRTQVTIEQSTHTVTQVYCSALPVSYTEHPKKAWELFAKLVLEAAYEATFCVALLNQLDTGVDKVFLTLLGGGVFGNESDWILSAIERSLKLFHLTSLDVAIVSYRSSNPQVQSLIRKFDSWI